MYPAGSSYHAKQRKKTRVRCCWCRLQVQSSMFEPCTANSSEASFADARRSRHEARQGAPAHRDSTYLPHDLSISRKAKKDNACVLLLVSFLRFKAQCSSRVRQTAQKRLSLTSGDRATKHGKELPHTETAHTCIATSAYHVAQRQITRVRCCWCLSSGSKLNVRAVYGKQLGGVFR